jgi:hypothetical protein
MTIAPLLHPALRRVPPQERKAALREARRTPLDILELVGTAAGLIAGILFMRGGLDSVGVARGAWESSTLESVIAGVAVAAIIAGFFFVRRTRRGLALVLRAHG